MTAQDASWVDWSAASTERIPLRPALPGATAVIYLSETAAERAVHHKLAVLEAEVARLAEQVEARRRPLVSRDTVLIGVGLGLLGVAAYLGTTLWTLAAG